MDKLKDIAAAQQAQQSGYFADPRADRAMALLLEVAEEVCVLRDRLNTVEKLAEQGLPISPSAIDGYDIDPDEAAQRLSRHRDWYASLFRRLAESTDNRSG